MLSFRQPLFAGKEFLARPGEAVAPNQLIVGLEPGADINGIVAAMAPQAVARLISASNDTYVIKLPAGSLAAVSRLLAAHPLVQFVEPDRIYRTTVLPPNDPLLPQQWALTAIHAEQAWSYFPDHYLTAAASGSNRVKVALIDSGVDCTHPDFMKAGGTSTDSAQGGQLLWAQSRAIIATTVPSPACPWQDDQGHGTHTAGTIAAATNNGAGVAAVGYPLQIIVYKVFDTTGSGLDSDIATAIDDAISAGAQVISMSIGAPGYSQTLQQAVDRAWQHNILVVSAAGNSGTNDVQYPGDANHGLGVAATDTNSARASFSSFGNWVKIAAPGVNILSTVPTYPNTYDINYGSLSGTSMATPHVAAVGGLLFMANPGLSAAAAAQRLQQTAQTSHTGWDQEIGYGVVDAAAALSGKLRTATQGSIVGQVVNSIGMPVTGAQVTAAAQTFTTADDGLFRIVNISPGTYAINVSSTGFSAVNLQAAAVAGADTMLAIPMGVALGEFTGTVTHNGVPVAGAAIEVISTGLIRATAVTDGSGVYAVYLRSGTYTLTASALNYVNATSSSTTLGNGGTVTVNLALSALGTLTGTVTDVNGQSVAGAHINFTNGSFSGGATTGADGTYSTFGLPAGTYTVTASASLYSDAVAGAVSVVNNTSTLVNLQFSTAVTLTTGLLGYWPFDEGSGTVAHDQSGNGRDAALSKTAWSAGKFNTSLSFNGTDSAGLSPPIPFTNTFSVSAWVNPAVTTQGSFARIVETRYDSGFDLGVDATGTKYKFIVNSGAGSTGGCGASFGCAEGGPVTGGWHLVTATYDGAAATLYVDGLTIASDTATAPANASLPLNFGQGYLGLDDWNGSMDDVRLYSRVLTAKEIATLFGQPAVSLSLTNAADAAAVSAGTAIGFTLTAANSGTGTASTALLSDTLPAGPGISWSINPAYSGPGTCTIASGVLSCNFGNLASGGTATVRVTSATSAASCAAYSNTATLTTTSGSAPPASATTTVLCPNLNLADTADANTVPAGTAIGYTLALTNSGAGTAASANLNDSLPAGAGVTWSIQPVYSGPGACTFAGGALVCNFGNLAPGATATVHVTSSTSTSSCAVYQNNASALAGNAAQTQASASTTVLCPNLTINQTHMGVFYQGQPGVTYAVTVLNSAGSPPTTGLTTVTETVPIGLTLVSMAGDGWTCPALGKTCSRSDPLNGGSSYPAIVVTVNVDPAAPLQLTNQVSVSGGGSSGASSGDVTVVSPFSCDLNNDQFTNIVDVQTVINEALGILPKLHDLNHDGVIGVADIAKAINATLGFGCPF